VVGEVGGEGREGGFSLQVVIIERWISSQHLVLMERRIQHPADITYSGPQLAATRSLPDA
jgi:hypothetical protein